MDPEAEAGKERYRRYAPELGLLLWAVWDPIGVGVPLNEYEMYVPLGWKLLDEHAGIDAIADELARIADERIGTDRGTNRDAAQRVTEWWRWRFDFVKEVETNA